MGAVRATRRWWGLYMKMTPSQGSVISRSASSSDQWERVSDACLW